MRWRQMLKHGKETIALAERLDRIRMSEGIAVDPPLCAKPLHMNSFFLAEPRTVKVMPAAHSPPDLTAHAKLMQAATHSARRSVQM
jgi:hypothetical protein